MRNRLIAGASKGLVVIAAKKISGTVNTINWALNGRTEVFCCPAPITEDSACNEAIRDGAKLALSGQDILETLGICK